MIDIIESVQGEIAAFDLGDWKITEVKGDIVKAEAYNLTTDNRPKVNILAIIHTSPGSVHAEEAPKVNNEKTSSPTAKGKVIMTREMMSLSSYPRDNRLCPRALLLS